MKQVSNAYKLSMKSMLREQSFVEITFSQVDTAAATDGNWVSNGAQSYSEFDTLDYGYDYQESYAALELNRWALDGNTIIVPSSCGLNVFLIFIGILPRITGKIASA